MIVNNSSIFVYFLSPESVLFCRNNRKYTILKLVKLCVAFELFNCTWSGYAWKKII